MVHDSIVRMDKTAVRELFPVTRNLIYFNHAAVAPLSTRACRAMGQHARDQHDRSALQWREWYAEHDHLRAAATRLIGAQPQEISTLKNTSEGRFPAVERQSAERRRRGGDRI